MRRYAISAFTLPLALATAVAAGGPPAAEVVARADELYARGEFTELVSLVDEALEEDRSPAERAVLRERLAFALVELGRHADALIAVEHAEIDAHVADDRRVLARLEIVRGTVARNEGRALDAVALYQTALEVAERAAAPKVVAHALSLLASGYQTLGDWSRVVEFNERAFAANPQPTPRQRFSYLMQRGIGLYEFGDGERAAASFREALDLAVAEADLRSQSFATGELGLVAWSGNRDRDAALAAYDRAIELARRSGVPVLEVVWLLNSGSVLRDAGEPEAALVRFRDGLALAERVGLEQNRAFLLKNLGQVLAARGDREAAEPLLARALAEADRLAIGKLRWQARMELGDLYRDHDPALARRFYEESLDELEASQAGVLLEQLQVGALGRALEQYDPYARLIDFLMDRGESAAAFAVSERGRARVFLEHLAALRSAIAPQVPPDFLHAEREVLARISAEQAALRERGLDAGERRRRLQAIDAAEAELTLLRARLAAERPALAHERYPRLPSFDEVRREMLAEDEVLLAYFLGRRRSWAWAIDRRGVEFAELPAREELASLVEAFRDQLTRPVESFDRAAGGAVWDAVVAPIAGRLRRGAHLVVLPHGALHRLPFEALPRPDGRFLVETHSLSYAPSAASLAFLRHAPQGSGERRVLAIGNPVADAQEPATTRGSDLALLGWLKPLPHSGEELRRIAEVFGDSAELLEGEAATEARLAAAPLTEIGVLHFATHALVDERRPERSGLTLTPQPPDDGLLQVREIYGLRTNAALVTLSACETALGRDVAGEGLIGLARAFFHAGAGAVTATLWSVDDVASAELMRRFYREVHRGRPVDRALAAAKRSLLRDGGRTAHPYYWAPYVVVGHGGARLPTPRWPAAALALAAVIGLAVAVALSRRARRRSAARPTP